MNCDILQQDIQSLLEYFSKVMYKAKECDVGSVVSLLRYLALRNCHGQSVVGRRNNNQQKIVSCLLPQFRAYSKRV